MSDMLLYKRAKSKTFWEGVRTNPEYGFLIDELLVVYERLGKEELKDYTYNQFMEYYRNGSRQTEDTIYHPRRLYMSVCALLSLIYPDNQEYFDNLMDIIWSICNDYSWALPACTTASDRYFVDLFASETGAALAEICALLGERMEPVIKERIHGEIQKRIIDPYLNRTFWWESYPNNWAAVCAGNVACAFMHERPDLFWDIKPRIDRTMECYFSGFDTDWVCKEGLAYWQYGFGYYVDYAQRLYEFTEGKMDLFADERVRKIAGFPHKMFLDGDAQVSFSDAGRDGAGVGLGTIYLLHSVYGKEVPLLPMNYLYTHHRTGRIMLYLDAFVWYDPQAAGDSLDKEATFYMKESAWFVKKTAVYGFAAKGGDNGETHNHNDLGSFIYSHGGRQILVDLGAGEYTKEYFGEGRYRILCNRSAGHSVPFLDGAEQAAGKEYTAEMDYEEGKLTIDITGAYPKNRVVKAVREFTFTDDRVVLRDCFAYENGTEDGNNSCPVTERLVTLIKPEVADGVIRLEEVSIFFDGKLWTVSVSEEPHYLGVAVENVYLIDFVSELPAKEFRVEIGA